MYLCVPVKSFTRLRYFHAVNFLKSVEGAESILQKITKG